MSRVSHEDTVLLIDLEPWESELLADLASQLIELLETRGADGEQGSEADVLYEESGIGGPLHPPTDAALARLLPDAYRDDDAAASEHRRLTERSLVAAKIAVARSARSALATRPIHLDNAAQQVWLRWLNDVRLAVASRLGIVDDGDSGVGDTGTFAIYNWLGYLQSTVIEALE